VLNTRLRDLAVAEYHKRHPFKSFLKRLRGEDDGALVVRVSRTFPGYGVGVKNDNVYLGTGVALTEAGNPTIVPIPATGVILGTTAGKIRLKIYNGGGTTPTVTDILVTASDGTNTVRVFEYHPNVAQPINATNWFDRFFEYLLDTATLSTGAGGAAGQLLPGGATSFSIAVTLGGTTGTASLDWEIVPLV
jgi:hypothetical protein